MKKARGTDNPTHGLASTSSMRTDDNNSDNYNINDDGDDHIGDDEGVDNKVDDDHDNEGP